MDYWIICDDNLGVKLGSISKFHSELNIKSIHEKELFQICVGSLISWCKPFCEVTASFFLGGEKGWEVGKGVGINSQTERKKEEKKMKRSKEWII